MKKISRREFLKASAAAGGTVMLAGCGDSSNAGSTASGVQGSDSPKTVSYWIDPQNASGFTGESFDELACWQAIQENTGIDVTWQHPASGQSAEQFSLVVAGNEMPDIMYYSWGTGYSGGADAAIADGKILSLNDYMEEYAPNFTHYMELHPDMLADITTDSGNVYGFPAVYTSTAESSDVWQGVFDREPFTESFIGLVIRTDYLEKVNKEIPVTYDDWYDVLKAFKEQLGLKYPLSFMQMFETMAQAFGAGYGVCLPIPGYGAATSYGITKEGEIEFCPVKDGFKSYLAFMNKLYSEGLLDNDYMVQDRPTLHSKIVNGEVGAWIEMMPSGLGGLKAQVLAEDPENTFDALGVHSPVETVGTENWYHQANLPFIGSASVITSSCKDIPTAMALCDYLWGEEGNMLLNWGIEGESYQMVDGWPAFTDQIIHNNLGLSPSNAFSQYTQLNGGYPMDHWQRLTTKTDYSLAEGEVDKNIEALNTWSYGNGTQPAGLPATSLLENEQSKYANAFNEISTYVGEMMAKFITGAESLEKFDAYTKTVWDMDLQTCLEIQQAALERYYARTSK